MNILKALDILRARTQCTNHDMTLFAWCTVVEWASCGYEHNTHYTFKSSENGTWDVGFKADGFALVMTGGFSCYAPVVARLGCNSSDGAIDGILRVYTPSMSEVYHPYTVDDKGFRRHGGWLSYMAKILDIPATDEAMQAWLQDRLHSDTNRVGDVLQALLDRDLSSKGWPNYEPKEQWITQCKKLGISPHYYRGAHNMTMQYTTD